MSGYNFDFIQSRYGNAITKQAFDQLDALDGKQDNEIDNSVFDTVEEVIILYNSFIENKSEFKSCLEKASDMAKKVADILVPSFEATKDVAENEPVDTDTDNTIKRKKQKKVQDKEPPAVQRMEEIAKEILEKAEEAAKNEDDMFSNDITKIKNFPLGVVIKNFGIKINYDDPSNDDASFDILNGKTTIQRVPDGLEITIVFEYNGQTYTKKAFSKTENIMKQLKEDYTIERVDECNSSINGGNVSG
jgi:hypothetical protein